MGRVIVRIELDDETATEVSTEFVAERLLLPGMLDMIVHRSADAALRAAGQA